MKDETAGDPMSEQKWQRSSLRQLADELAQVGHWVSHTTVGRLLREMDYSLKANVKRLAGAAHPDRERQFVYLNSQKQAFLAAGLPVISVDTKKKELIGNFKNHGQIWCQEATAVNDHDFEQDALGKAVPYGIYDLQHNRGYVYVGKSADTPQFAVEMIARWWTTEGKDLYPNANKLLILADAGGSNGCRPRLWKQQLQALLADSIGLEVTVCHYPTGASKWNPIEHRLFGPISINWTGKPLRTFEFMLACIRGTVTTTGLQVKAFLVEDVYQKGIQVTKSTMETLSIEMHAVCPRWNYTIKPRLVSA
ncbi:MAG TPA: ISAzo13 family transposase [Anaerolineales bacterium]|nr:ISAzo13 family transposase [Anaerolineales bacterium]